MVPMIDLFIVTISFLLLTAVWTHTARLEGTSRMPGPADSSTEAPAARLHVEVPPDERPVRLSVRRGVETIDARTVPRRDLAASIDDMRRAHAADLAGAEPHVVVLHADDAILYRDMVAVMDTIARDPRATVNLATK